MDEPLEKVEAKIESGVTAPAPEGSLASDDEICNLRHVSAPLPMRVWLAATIGWRSDSRTMERKLFFVSIRSPSLSAMGTASTDETQPQKTTCRMDRMT